MLRPNDLGHVDGRIKIERNGCGAEQLCINGPGTFEVFLLFEKQVCNRQLNWMYEDWFPTHFRVTKIERLCDVAKLPPETAA